MKTLELAAVIIALAVSSLASALFLWPLNVKLENYHNCDYHNCVIIIYPSIYIYI